jgi:hypothetical protein
MSLGRKLDLKDVKILFTSTIPEKIALNLLDFDKVKNNNEVTPEFFNSLKELKWENNKIKDFYKRTEKLSGFFIFREEDMKENSFIVHQKRIIIFLAGCSAVKKGESVINIDDIILAYETLFKIIRTDISKLI